MTEDSIWAQLLLYSVHCGKDRKINKETQSILKVHLTHTHMYIQYPHTYREHLSGACASDCEC